MTESEKELKSLLMKMKEQSEKADLKLKIQKTKIIASSPITSWQTEGKKVEAVTEFIFLVSKITMDSDCSREIKRCLLHGRKAMTDLDSVLKSRDITLPTKVHVVKAMIFPVVRYRSENWDHKEGWESTNWCFWIVVLEKTPQSPLNCKEIKSVNPKGN